LKEKGSHIFDGVIYLNEKYYAILSKYNFGSSVFIYDKNMNLIKEQEDAVSNMIKKGPDKLQFKYKVNNQRGLICI